MPAKPPVARDLLTVYLITDRHQTRGRPLLDCIDRALKGGVRAVQLREKDLSARELLALARQLRTLTHRYGAALLVNDRIDVALASGADGVHLPANSFDVPSARRLLGPERLLGVSAHSTNQVVSAARAGADFAVFGPLFDTPLKRSFGPPLGVAALDSVIAATAIPIVAIGGVTADQAPDLLRRGAAGVAVIRAILLADDPTEASVALCRRQVS